MASPGPCRLGALSFLGFNEFFFLLAYQEKKKNRVKDFYTTKERVEPFHSGRMFLHGTQFQNSKHDLLVPYPNFSDGHRILKSTVTFLSNLFHQLKRMIIFF